MYKSILKPILFKKDPEKAHHFAFKRIKALMKAPGAMRTAKKMYRVDNQPVNLWGLSFPSRVGLAAGFDKDAKLFDELSVFGFGFIEIGTVTPKPQKGNPQPRLFRLPQDEALINRMGFNNEGVDAAVERLKKKKTNVIIGGNIGKNKVTPNEKAVDDYIYCFEKLFPYVDYFVVNVSSPNTPGLRELQDKEPLTALLNTLKQLNMKKDSPKPLLLKIAPDLTTDQVDDIIEIVNDTKIDGLIVSNTTIDRSGLKTDDKKVEQIGAGGLSGKPLRQKSTDMIRYISEKSNGKIKMIGVGGIHSPEAAIEKIEAGASLVQIYTGFIYEGPGFVKKINRAIRSKVDFKNK